MSFLCKFPGGPCLLRQFVGHNAFLRWKAIQSVAFQEDGVSKYICSISVSQRDDNGSFSQILVRLACV